MRLSDELVEAAKASARVFHRSPPQQIEHWAAIGRVLEPALSYEAKVQISENLQAKLDDALAAVEEPASVARTQSIIRETSGSIISNDE